MITVKLRQLEAARAKMASLEKAISAHRNKELGALPAKYGFDNVDDFIAAVRSAGGKRGPGRPAKAAAPAAAPHLIYRNGPLLTAVEVFTIFWGPAWLAAQSPMLTQINQFFDFILTSPLIAQLAEYSVPGKTKDFTPQNEAD